MKKQVIENRLVKLGYTIVYTYEGNVIAYKGQQSYKAASLNGLYKIIFKQL